MRYDLFLQGIRMCHKDIRSLVLGLQEVAAWPEMADTFRRVVGQGGVIEWELPLLACQAVGGEASAAIPGAAAVACMQLSLLLVDDMLDGDPRGVHLQIGEAATANLAFAFQAAAFRVIESASVEAGRRASVYASLAQMALTSAFGQSLDVQNLSGEENYWRVVEAKTASYFGTALYIGALLGGASLEVAGRLRDLGFLYGQILQVYDDLLDAFKSPASPDWQRGWNNLAILYALTADHPDSMRFRELLSQVSDSQALETAQQILICCGAASYCAYQLTERYQAAQQLLNDTMLADPVPIQDMLTRQISPLVRLFGSIGVEIPLVELGVV
jgi:geranylgeranyl diphosphate synthase type I